MRYAVRVVVAGLTAVLIAGCSSHAEAKKETGTSKGASGADPTASAVQAAKRYQEAVNDDDWQRACQMRTEQFRHGSVHECVTDNAAPDAPSPSPTESDAFPPLKRADGSTVPPKQTPSDSGPDRTETGTVTAGSSVSVPATGEHPAGTGVLIQFKVVQSDNTTTVRSALRVVRENNQWLVDQAEDIDEADDAHGNPVHDALMRN
ncbi:hypothetical protein ACF08B_36615 [Streptomyces sp. NPDC015139]|uniref:hypothetical protein n=1 Tax=Streptomyces sp. NPDC015139 TaxID=3364942 RepID=UPI003700251C